MPAVNPAKNFFLTSLRNQYVITNNNPLWTVNTPLWPQKGFSLVSMLCLSGQPKDCTTLCTTLRPPGEPCNPDLRYQRERGTGYQLCRVAFLVHMGNGVIKSHKSQTKPQYARCKAVQVF